MFLICDFGKGNPEQILLIPKSLPGHFTQGIPSGQGVTATAESGAHGAECRVYGICSYASNSMKSDNPHSGVYEADTARTLDNNCGNPACNQGGMAVVAFNGGASPQAGSIGYSDKVSPTLKAASSGLRTPCVCEPCVTIINDQGGSSLNIEKGDCAPTLRCSTHGNLPIVCTLPAIAMRMRAGCEGGGKGALLQTEKSGTLATGNDQYLFEPCAVHPDIVGTLCASGAGLSRPGGMGSEPDLTVAHTTYRRLRSDMFQESEIASTQTARQAKDATDLCVYCLQGNMIGRKDENGPRGDGVQTDLSYTLTATDTPAVAAVDCRNYKELGEISGTLQAKSSPGYSLNYQNPVRMGYVVRRLTPTECEALMGFERNWTAFGHDGQPISDSRRYSMLGNSIATPCAAYILDGILQQYAKEVIT